MNKNRVDHFFLIFAKPVCHTFQYGISIPFMFERLQKKWKVNGLQLTLILCTFAIGGSLTGYAGRKLMGFLPVDKGWLWVVIYIIVVTILWPVAVVLVSIAFGQFNFFTGYLKKMGKRMGMIGKSGVGSRESGVSATQLKNNEGVENTSRPDSYRVPTPDSRLTTQNPLPVRIAIFASGKGSNTAEIISYFGLPSNNKIKIALIVSNKSKAGVLSIAEQYNIPALIIEKEKFFNGNGYVDELKEHKIDLIVLAGFLWKIPLPLIKAYPGKIINIHPALLPKYGGKGMYGRFVHQAAINNKEKKSGITIHYVDEVYDHGDIIFQASCPVLESDTADSLAKRIHQLEHQHYPEVIQQVINKLKD
ncbi:MAG TPA: phosphoribosylglycinamide formyltransferase [Chitinophagaceae bacterium]